MQHKMDLTGTARWSPEMVRFASIHFALSVLFFACCEAVIASAPSGPWDEFNYAPTSRALWPTAIHKTVGSVRNADQLVSNKGTATLAGNGSWVALDFGKEVGGLISMNFDAVSSFSAISLSFTESPIFIGPLASDDSSYPASNMSYDGVLEVPAPLSNGYWTQPADRLRGGFRFLSIILNSDESVTLSNVSCVISFMPHVVDMTDYAGYFYASDSQFGDKNFLTRLWYAGAYTVQTNTVPLNTGREVPFVSSPGWENNATLGITGPIIVDGAKRDRAVWPGDMGIAVPTQFVSTNDLLPTRNALSTMFAAQDPTTGALPESGPPLSQTGSDTYHMWTLIGTHNYYLYSGDINWLCTVWSNYTKAVRYVENKVTPVGLMNVTGLRDWARLGGGGINAEGNAILYKVLTNSVDLATYLDQTALASAWETNATSLKAKFNEEFWLPDVGMYRDNGTTTLTPQDANSFAVVFNVTDTETQAQSISAGLEKNWNSLGPVCPELPDTISPFISGFELQAHFVTGNDNRALDILRREWGYILYTNLSVQSTLLEGFTANGSLSYRSYRGYNYDPSYTSHSHGWSSGPTSAMTFYILGLQITSPKGQTWSVAPHLSGLQAAQGGYETALGWYGVKWTISDGEHELKIEIFTPAGTEGIVRVPQWRGRVLLDGRVMTLTSERKVELEGGNHTLVMS